MLPEYEPLPASNDSQVHSADEWEDNINLNKESQTYRFLQLCKSNNK